MLITTQQYLKNNGEQLRRSILDDKFHINPVRIVEILKEYGKQTEKLLIEICLFKNQANIDAMDLVLIISWGLHTMSTYHFYTPTFMTKTLCASLELLKKPASLNIKR
ncbi:hypothetical protein OXPF_11270 [Oxobacter pfennigii]|uniref:Uncharacterized protein n=1 Tax=Oxobacter pfennigii TaxID=36849 RepID=A0A0P8YDB9_9CLOT|nr:hypothetical protein OXPF_11270 [Oxobacter pfennigii]